MAGYAAAPKKLLRDCGCFYKRPGKGDHEIWHSPISNTSFLVDSKIKSRHTANETLKQAGLGKEFKTRFGGFLVAGVRNHHDILSAPEEISNTGFHCGCRLGVPDPHARHDLHSRQRDPSRNIQPALEKCF